MPSPTIQVFKGIARDLRKRVPLSGAGEGFTTVADGREIAEIEVIVDLAQIARDLGPRAMANRSGRSRYMGGAVIVNVLRSHKES